MFGDRALQTTDTQTDALPYSLNSSPTSPPDGYAELVEAMQDVSGDLVGPWPVTYICRGTGAQREVGIGILTAGTPDTVSRDTIFQSSDGFGVPVNWGAGTKTIWLAPISMQLYSLITVLASGSNGLLNKTAAYEVGLVTLGAAAAALLDDANAAAQRATLGLSIGSDVQAYDADLAAIAALSHTSGRVIRSNGSAWLAAVLAAADVSVASAVSPLSGSDVEAVLDSAGTALATHDTQFSNAFSKSYTSSAQTITAAGLLTLAHGLGVKPKLVIARLTCTSTDLAWSAGDTVEIGSGVASSENQNRGHAIYTDTTNINVRFASGTPVYQIPQKSGGSVGNTGDIDPTKWTVTFIAFA